MLISRKFAVLAIVGVAVALINGCNKTPASPTPVASMAPASPLRLDFKVVPDHPSMAKPMTFIVHVADPNGQAVNDAQVSGLLTMKLMDMGSIKLSFTSKGNGDYETSMKSMDMSGPWNLAVDAAQGNTKVKKNFEVNVFD